MTLHAIDSTGDWLPAPSASSCCTGAEAVAHLARFRLTLFPGDWWENPALGCPVLDQMTSARLSESALSRLSDAITSYILRTPDVLSLSDVACTQEGQTIRYSCTLITAYGEASLRTTLQV